MLYIVITTQGAYSGKDICRCWVAYFQLHAVDGRRTAMAAMLIDPSKYKAVLHLFIAPENPVTHALSYASKICDSMDLKQAMHGGICRACNCIKIQDSCGD